MTATNICYNFVGFRCSPPQNYLAEEREKKLGQLRNICSNSVVSGVVPPVWDRVSHMYSLSVLNTVNKLLSVQAWPPNASVKNLCFLQLRRLQFFQVQWYNSNSHCVARCLFYSQRNKLDF